MTDAGVSSGSDGASPRDGFGLRAAALLLAGSALLSRILGYVRDAVLANQVGAGAETDAYFAAFMLPDILNYLLAGGALAIAFMPLYNRVRANDGEAEAERLFATILGTLGVVVIAVTALLWLWADDIVATLYPAFSAETRELTVRLTRIVLPAQIFFVTGGVMRSVLMARGNFTAQAFAPICYNGLVIAGGLATGEVEGFAWGVLAGAATGAFLFPMVQLLRRGQLRVRVAFLDGDFRTYLWLALPLMLGMSLTTVDEWYEKLFGQLAGEGGIAALAYARKLMMAPVAIVGQAMAAAALPTLSRLHSLGDQPALHRILLRTLRESLALAVLSAAALCAVAPLVVEVLYHHGRFTSQNAIEVSMLLRILSLAIPGWVLQQVSVRAFYAREDTWRPMFLGTFLAIAAIPLYLGLAQSQGTSGIALAGVIAMTVNAVATLGWGTARFGGPPLGPLVMTLVRTSLVGAAAGLAASWCQPTIWGLQLATGWLGAFVDLACAGVGFAVVAGLGVASVGDEALRTPILEALRRIRGR